MKTWQVHVQIPNKPAMKTQVSAESQQKARMVAEAQYPNARIHTITEVK